MARVSVKQLETLAEILNAMYLNRGSSARVEIGHRNGYCALDLTTDEYLEEGNGRTVKTLTIGSTGEIASYLWAMQEGLFLLDEPYASSGRH